MQVKTLLFWEAHIVVVVAAAGLLVWRYWYVPRAQASRPPAQSAQKVTPVPRETRVPVVAKEMPSTSAPKAAATKPSVPEGRNLVRNGLFDDDVKNWSWWRATKEESAAFTVVDVDNAGAKRALRIVNTTGKLMGVQQPVSVVSGSVYRLTAMVRSTSGTTSTNFLGARVAFYLPPQSREPALVWVTDNAEWWPQSIVFTNMTAGVATLYAHMGYGNAIATGEFTNIRLECLTP